MKEYIYRKALFMLIVSCILIIEGGTKIFAENSWIDTTLSAELSLSISDDIRDRVYLADSGNSKLVIIDSQSEEVSKSISLPGKITDMSISKDGTQLAAVSAGNIVLVNLNTLRAGNLSLPKTIKGKVRSVAFDQNRHIFCVTAEKSNNGWIYHLSASGGSIINKFGVGSELDEEVYNGLIKTDLSGTKLYVRKYGTSSILYKIDIAKADKPAFLAESQDGELRVGLTDFVLSPRYDEIYIAHQATAYYEFQVVDANTLRVTDSLEAGAYPCGLAVSRYGDKIYGINCEPSENYMSEYDAKTKTRIKTYQLLSNVSNEDGKPRGESQPRGIAIDRFAEKVFVNSGSDYYDEMKVQVVDVDDAIQSED